VEHGEECGEEEGREMGGGEGVREKEELAHQNAVSRHMVREGGVRRRSRKGVGILVSLSALCRSKFTEKFDF